MNKKTLVYCGGHSGGTANNLIPNFDLCYIFEPISYHFQVLQNTHKDNQKVKLFNCALGERKEKSPFYIYSNQASSSLSPFTSGCAHNANMHLTETIEVQCINLYELLCEENVIEIDYYMSDIQGMDFTVLNTLKPLLDKRAINKITCEVEKDEAPTSYVGLSNKYSNFERLLKNNYRITNVFTQPLWECSDITWELV